MQANICLADAVPKVRPFVPNIIRTCIQELEARGLTKEGIYRTQGVDDDVNALLYRYESDIPLQPFDDPVLATCVKRFLRSLSEPLIPTNSAKGFVEVGKGQDTELLKQQIIALPQPNKDTLAFLILHLQKVVQMSEKNKMDDHNLAVIFAPTLLGDTAVERSEIEDEITTVNSLLNIPAEWWTEILAA